MVLLLLLQRCLVVTPSSLKLFLCATDIILSQIIAAYFCFIDNTIFQAISIHRTNELRTVASTIIQGARYVRTKNFLVMTRNDGGHVLSATIA